MTPYPHYKDSGVGWIGEIPEKWGLQKIKYISNINHKSLSENTDPEYEFFYIDIGNVTLGQISENIQKIKFKDAPSRARRITRNGDTLVSTVRTYLKAITIVDLDEEDLIASTGFAVLAPKSINERFFAYLMMSELIIDTICSLSVGVSYPAVNASDVANIPIWYPNELSEQEAIANYLDHKTAVLDNLIAQKQHLIELLQEERTAVISQAATQGLDPHAPRRPSGIPWLGDIPAHWEVLPLTKYMDSIVDYRGKTPTKGPSGLLLITARNIKNGFIDYSLSEEYVDEEEALKLLNRGLPKTGDVLFTTEAPLGEVANVDKENIALAQRIIKFRGKKGLVDNYYLKMWMASSMFQHDLQSYATGSTAVGIKASKLVFLKLVLPPLDEQSQIVKHINQKIFQINYTITQTEEQIALLQEYRTTLISQVVTGKIDIRQEVVP